MKKSNNIQSKIGVFDKDSIPTFMLCRVDTDMHTDTLGEIEGSRVS